MKHHHVVMTLPKVLRHICKLNDELIYNLLFELSSKVLQDWFMKKHGLIPGIVSVLHTAGSDLKEHPHVHMIVSAGGLNQSNYEIKKLKSYFLTRQRFLANKLREAMVLKLSGLYKRDKLIVPKRWNKTNGQFLKWLQTIGDKQWIVSIQKPLENLNQIVGYVGRYTKRACISEYKIVRIKNDYVSFKYNDYKNTPRGEAPLQSIKKLHYVEFLDQLLKHVPNKSFRMVRYYGAYTSHYKKYLPINEVVIKEVEKVELEHSWGEFEELRKKDLELGKPDPLTCPHCKVKLKHAGLIFIKTIHYDDS